MQRCPSFWGVKPCVSFCCTENVQKMLYSVNEYNLSEKQLSGCQSMIAWFSDVNEMDTVEIMCHTFKQETLYWFYLLLIWLLLQLSLWLFSFVSGSCTVDMHISTNWYNGLYLATFFIISENTVCFGIWL